MADIRKVVKVFLASPGDLQDERRTAKSVVDEFNNLWSESFGYHVELVGWEDTISSYGRPQAIINLELARCELLIGMMWKRWGTPPDNSGPYTSGFEEEFKTSLNSRQQLGRPEISLFFKNVDEDQLRDPGDELKKVIAFKNQIVSEKAILFQTFGELREFERKIRSCITRYVQNLRAKEASGLSETSQALPLGENPPQSVAAVASTPNTPFSVEGAKFLREFISKTERAAEDELIESVEVARFRLLGDIIGRRGNDERSLGVHDANLLFANRSNLKLGDYELSGLIMSGLENFSSENTLLWCWVVACDGFSRKVLSKHSISGTTATRVGALSAMRLVSDPLNVEEPFERSDYLNSWFSKGSASALKIAALGYVGDCGEMADLPVIQAELDRRDYQTTTAESMQF